MLYIISSAAWGVDRVVGVSDRHAMRLSCFSFLCCFVERLWAHTRAPSVNFGRIMPVYTHLMSLGLGPKYDVVLRAITFMSVLHWSIGPAK